jgi:hypothetical protein
MAPWTINRIGQLVSTTREIKVNSFINHSFTMLLPRNHHVDRSTHSRSPDSPLPIQADFLLHEVSLLPYVRASGHVSFSDSAELLALMEEGMREMEVSCQSKALQQNLGPPQGVSYSGQSHLYKQPLLGISQPFHLDWQAGFGKSDTGRQ